jgi:hypothetical protein
MLEKSGILPLPSKELKEMSLHEFDSWLISLPSEARIGFISAWTSEIFSEGYGCGGNSSRSY